MKRRHKLSIIIIVTLIALGLSYQLIRAAYTLDLFEAMQYNNFQIGMSEMRAESLFSVRGKLLTLTEKPEELELPKELEEIMGKITFLTFVNGQDGFEEILTLYFTNGKLSGFIYGNLKVGKE